MRAAANPARRRANRLTTARALAVSLGLHAAAAAAYGGYQLGGYADAPPSLDLGGGGGTFVAISIRGAPGGPAAGPLAPPADVVLNLEDLLRPVVVTEAVSAPPVPELPPPPPVVQPPAVIAVLDVAGPALADLASEVSRDVVEVVAASLEGARRQASRPPAPPPGGGGGPGEGRGDGLGEAEAGGAGGSGEGGGSGLGVGRNPLPDYPQEARLAGQEGEVIVLMLCDATGKVQDAWIEKSSGFPLLDEAALAAVKTWTFVPPVVDGKAVPSYVRRPIGFKLAR